MFGTFTDTCKVSILCGPFPNYVPTALGVRQSRGFQAKIWHVVKICVS